MGGQQQMQGQQQIQGQTTQNENNTLSPPADKQKKDPRRKSLFRRIFHLPSKETIAARKAQEAAAAQNGNITQNGNASPSAQQNVPDSNLNSAPSNTAAPSSADAP